MQNSLGLSDFTPVLQCTFHITPLYDLPGLSIALRIRIKVLYMFNEVLCAVALLPFELTSPGYVPMSISPELQWLRQRWSIAHSPFSLKEQDLIQGGHVHS